MSLATTLSRARLGISAPQVTVEVHLSGGLPCFQIVGLPETSVRESKDRVRSALINSGFDFPVSRIVVNLAPADLPKEGGRFDLPIAIGILLASNQLPAKAAEAYEFIGELGLSGELREIDATLPAARYCAEAKRILVLPKANSGMATLVSPESLREADSLLSVVAHLSGQSELPLGRTHPHEIDEHQQATPDLRDVRGQLLARRALEIAAAGGHSLLFCGPPGTGKSMLASRLPSILPPLTESEKMDIATLQSVVGKPIKLQRPFRSPHHTASAAALVGGGSQPRPGEISLAHRGVLFLDELPEFPRRVLEVLREPLESGEVVISRASQQLTFPARFQLITAMNPCPCGYDGDQGISCRCTAAEISRYRNRLSGPLLDRIDLRVTVPRLLPGELQSTPPGESSKSVKARVIKARQIQERRQSDLNAFMPSNAVYRFCELDQASRAWLQQLEQDKHLSSRAQHRLIKTARTIADLTGCADILLTHLQEAALYRGDF
ncbi:YifB family Mg chelatase-like AAA ATPase [Spongiibacter sp. KMU-158]|uniref:YifB family Mg chelatase-like AAA ATPase n=1 Tax=Spongiibacter pelagi TaxID=2760804 RepID=A0A927C0H0_9GAMM|nr:YifB family Mg chelatase-like AAA ATPase [Spongiibacter pelagi]MBD2857918.1 YifB family Mg chelatase-like AAA ATPase [Spongiibacter pelagi]